MTMKPEFTDLKAGNFYTYDRKLGIGSNIYHEMKSKGIDPSIGMKLLHIGQDDTEKDFTVKLTFEGFQEKWYDIRSIKIPKLNLSDFGIDDELPVLEN